MRVIQAADFKARFSDILKQIINEGRSMLLSMAVNIRWWRGAYSL